MGVRDEDPRLGFGEGGGGGEGGKSSLRPLISKCLLLRIASPPSTFPNKHSQSLSRARFYAHFTPLTRPSVCAQSLSAWVAAVSLHELHDANTPPLRRTHAHTHISGYNKHTYWVFETHTSTKMEGNEKRSHPLSQQAREID